MTLNKRYPSVRNNGAEANRYSIFHLTSRLPANSLFDNVHKTRIIFVISFRPPHEQMCDTKISNLSLPLRARLSARVTGMFIRDKSARCFPDA